MNGGTLVMVGTLLRLSGTFVTCGGTLIMVGTLLRLSGTFVTTSQGDMVLTPIIVTRIAPGRVHWKGGVSESTLIPSCTRPLTVNIACPVIPGRVHWKGGMSETTLVPFLARPLTEKNCRYYPLH